ncbi:unnamed protein product [Durusdinium trenchii]|uniref:Uncharacterized protein n=1 Tax=Durusdinium trenchii TaxID=1381693 RepID=A0ABP0J7L5_9DINO
MHPLRPGVVQTQKDLEAANMLRSRLQGFGGVAPAHLPGHDIINFLQQVATGGSSAAAPTPKVAPIVVPAVVAPTTVPAPRAPVAPHAHPGGHHAPWHAAHGVAEGFAATPTPSPASPPAPTAPGPTFSKATPVPPPKTLTDERERSSSTRASATDEDLAQALSSHLQNPSGAPTAELLQALARAAHLEDEEVPKPPAFDSWETQVASPPPPPEGEPGPSLRAQEPPPPPDEPSFGGRAARHGALNQLARNAVTAAGSSVEAQAAAKAAVEHLMKSLEGKTPAELLEADAGSLDGEGHDASARAVAIAAAGPETCTFRYDLTPNDDAEATFRNIRRRIELEMSDGCVVQISLQMVRRPAQR